MLSALFLYYFVWTVYSENNGFIINIFQSKQPGRTRKSRERTRQGNENKKKIAHLKHIDMDLANHIMEEIVERLEEL